MEVVVDFILQSSFKSKKVSCFLYNFQQPTMKIDQEAYSRILLVLRLEPDLVSNTYAKQILESYESEQKFFPTQQSPQTGRGTSKQTTTEKEKNETTNQQKANKKKWSRFVF